MIFPCHRRATYRRRHFSPRRWENHLYEQVKNEADRTELAANSIPNRHAAIHGLVPYSTEKSSLNSIFLTDFVFHIITEMKREIIKDVIQILNNMVGPVSWTAAR